MTHPTQVVRMDEEYLKKVLTLHCESSMGLNVTKVLITPHFVRGNDPRERSYVSAEVEGTMRRTSYPQPVPTFINRRHYPSIAEAARDAEVSRTAVVQAIEKNREFVGQKYRETTNEH